jgi:hypothetical protein
MLPSGGGVRRGASKGAKKMPMIGTAGVPPAGSVAADDADGSTVGDDARVRTVAMAEVSDAAVATAAAADEWISQWVVSAASSTNKSLVLGSTSSLGGGSTAGASVGGAGSTTADTVAGTSSGVLVLLHAIVVGQPHKSCALC